MRISAQTEKIPQKQAGIPKKCLPASADFLCLFPGRKKEYNGEKNTIKFLLGNRKRRIYSEGRQSGEREGL